MNALEGLLYGFSVAVTPENLLAAFLGALLGTAIGVLPGLGPIAGAAIVLPLTFSLPPVTGLIALAGIFYGAMYGGSTTSVLVNIPGEVASIVTCLDGYQMTRRGRAGAALSIMAIGSFVAGTLALIGVVLFSPPLANLALAFGPPEYLALMLVSLLVLSGISGGSFIRSVFVTTLGLMLATVGIEAVSGVPRFTFDNLELSRGVQLVPVAVGLYGVSEIFFLVESLVSSPKPESVRLRDLLPNRAEWRRTIPAWFRGTVLGFFIGLLPGPVGPLSTFASYRLEKAISPHKEEFGHGAVEGVAGPEAANNAASSSSFVPLLSLGVPFAPILALLVAAMMVQGIQPGPLLMTQHPEIFWGVIASMYLGNVMLLVLNLPLVGMWVSLLRIPLHLLVPGIVIFAMIGAYSVDNATFDLWVLLIFGVIGYFLRKLEFEMAPFILAIVLGPRVEKHLREGLILGLGDPWVFFQSPVAKTIWIAGLLMLAGPPVLKLIRRSAAAKPSPTGSGESL